MIKKYLSGIIFVFIFSSISFAVEVLDIGAGARSIGLGRAYNAVSADGYSIFANPAGIAGISTKEIVSMFGNMSGDMSYSMLGFIMPLKSGALSIGYAGSKTGDIYSTTVEAATGRIASLSTFNWGNEIYLISYGNRHKERVGYGVTIKYFKKGTSQIKGGEGSGMNVDAGIMYDVNPRLRFGLMAKNILLKMGSIKWINGNSEELPLEIKSGFHLKLAEKANVLFDLNMKADHPSEIKFGIEWFVRKSLALRFGAEQLASSSSTKYTNLTVGTGIVLGAITVDYAYYYDSLFNYNSRHFISLAIEMPKPAASGSIRESLDKSKMLKGDKKPIRRIPMSIHIPRSILVPTKEAGSPAQKKN